MEKTKKDRKFEKWLKDNIRLAGEELIRRADEFTTDGLDHLTDLTIKIAIPTYQEKIVFPSMGFSFCVVNKKHSEWISRGEDLYVSGRCLDGPEDVSNLDTEMPSSGTEGG